MDKIKPCPFCGSDVKEWFWVDLEWVYCKLYCDKCKAIMEQRTSFEMPSSNNPGHNFIKLENELIEKWNKRTI